MGTVATQRPSPFYTEEHEVFRDQVRRFVRREIRPYVDQWDEEGSFPRTLYRKAAEAGLLQLRFPEPCGGMPADRFHAIVLQQELSMGGSGGIVGALTNHSIALPALARAGQQALKARVIPPVLAGEKVAALACTESTGGSDIGGLRTTARRDGDHYVLKGEKTFVSSGLRADFVVVVARTGGAGVKGLSLLLVDGDAPRLSRTPLRKMGWWPSDTATLYFDDVRVPCSHLIGPENAGFGLLADNFNDERLGLAASSIAFARLAYDEALAWSRARETFGQPLIGHQVIRHKLVDMAQRVAASQALLELTAWRMDQGDAPVAELCMLKNQATQTLAHCASEGVQIFGGAGYLRGNLCERIYREVKVNAIGGGSEEIMKELAARQLRYLTGNVPCTH